MKTVLELHSKTELQRSAEQLKQLRLDLNIKCLHQLGCCDLSLQQRTHDDWIYYLSEMLLYSFSPFRFPTAPSDPSPPPRHLLSGQEGGGSVGGPASAGRHPEGAV